jgi:dTDP-4-dehydrorhamnose reductase
VVQDSRPQAIVNAAAYTAVDQAESEPELAWAVNAAAPQALAEEARRSGAMLIHFSTEYVFDGTLGRAYREDDPPNPLNVYGKSKLAGDMAVQEAGGACLILRPSWVFSNRQGGFVNKVLGWARQQRALRVVSDQVGNPTWCRMLAETVAQLLGMGGKDPAGWLGERRGLYHLAGSGSASRFEWAQAILDCDPHKEEQVTEEILPARTEEFPAPAQRPLHAPLDCDRFTETFGLRLPDWKEALWLALH